MLYSTCGQEDAECPECKSYWKNPHLENCSIGNLIKEIEENLVADKRRIID